MAQFILAAALPKEQVEVTSAGTAAMVGYPIEPDALRVLKGMGLAKAAAGHRARQVTKPMVAEADLILTATRDHRARLVEAYPALMRRAMTLREFARLAGPAQSDAAWPGRESGAQSVDRLRQAVTLVVAQRGRAPVPAVAADDDVMDPYGLGLEAFEASAGQIRPAVIAGAAALRSLL